MIEKRLEKVRKKMEEMGLDALIVSSPSNCFYLTSFEKPNGDFRSIELLITQNNLYVVTNYLYLEAVKEWVASLPEIGRKEVKVKAAEKGGPVKIFSEICKGSTFRVKHGGMIDPLRSVGFEAEDLKFSEYLRLSKALSALSEPADQIFTDLRKIKDLQEQDFIRKAAAITDTAFKQIVPKIKPGMTEKELAAEIDYRLLKNGADGSAYETIVAFGKSSATPHHKTGHNKLKDSEIILLDFGARFNGYCSDMTRTIFFGGAAAGQKEIYRKVLEAQKIALEKICSDMTGKEADSLARNYFKGQKLDQYFVHNLGHSFGLNIHESPSLSPVDSEKLREGMVFTVEPGLYFPGKFGVRIEDNIIVRGHGIENITRSPKELIEL